MTEKGLGRERTIFLSGFVILAVLAVSFRILTAVVDTPMPPAVEQVGLVAMLISKLVFVYLVFRLSRYLGQPVWVTTLFCVLTPFSLLWLIPFACLLAEASGARRRLRAQPTGQAESGAVVGDRGHGTQVTDTVKYYCLSCKSDIDEDARLCPKCGADVSTLGEERLHQP